MWQYFCISAKKAKLESIVWPEILKMAEEETNRLYREGKKVVILDAAVLLTAGWHEKCDEVKLVPLYAYVCDFFNILSHPIQGVVLYRV